MNATTANTDCSKRKRYYIPIIRDLLPNEEDISDGTIRIYLSYGRSLRKHNLLDEMLVNLV